ncbi:MAG: hypothetical protein KGM98_14365 [Bacteroidota bacterium]|nr:hypothetical protein [Bacteroidota bacterium]
MNHQKVNKTKRFEIRLKEADHQRLIALYQKSTCRSLASFSSMVVFNQPVTLLTRNASMDDLMAELIALRREFSAAENTFRDLVQKLDGLDQGPENLHWLLRIDSHQTTFLEKMEEINLKIAQLSDLWLQL